MGVISQRPVEISDTVIAQMSNFLIFKMTHPKDIKYIEEMLPNISEDIIAICLAFAAGAMLYIVSGELIPESNKLYQGRMTAIGNGMLIKMKVIN